MKKSRNKKHDPEKFWCKECGSPNICIGYVETVYGRASVCQVDDRGKPYDFEDYQTVNSDNFEITGYECFDCGHSSGAWKEVVTIEPNDVINKKNFEW